ncbi:hypothetical protein T552_00353 [Pneumocystis carinii B80]|uniref:Yeast cell wall synthesis Kre9/Knh1-like N-terminal domain-containing protein n=2 Tax=Pneumocystis carinii TaxID=4754 RepID=A0A0W4ZQJ5_PNEC8|nr:hypothetical protein T552_00353 [Pneumocystis carinii B80]KTW30637.1 hypothetical protein T552_00353 [Pneumocystis carinii B80]
MGFLFVTFLFSIIALINAIEILYPKAGDKLQAGLHEVKWTTESATSIDKVNVFLFNDKESPPFYLQLAADVTFSNGKVSVPIPYNVVPGPDYTILLTAKNPYDVYATSGSFSIAESKLSADACVNFLNEDGSSTIGPVPGKVKPVSTDLVSPLPPAPPDEDFEDCDECDECEECGECEPDEGCGCDGDDGDGDGDGDDDDEHDHEHGHDHDHEDGQEHEDEDGHDHGHEHEDGHEHHHHDHDDHHHEHDDDKAKIANIGSTNIIARFWLAMIATISSILFL